MRKLTAGIFHKDFLLCLSLFVLWMFALHHETIFLGYFLFLLTSLLTWNYFLLFFFSACLINQEARGARAHGVRLPSCLYPKLISNWEESKREKRSVFYEKRRGNSGVFTSELGSTISTAYRCWKFSVLKDLLTWKLSSAKSQQTRVQVRFLGLPICNSAVRF